MAEGRWDLATRDDFRLSKQLRNKTIAQDTHLRKSVEKIDRERRNFLGRFADEKAKIFRRLNRIKTDRVSARRRLQESVEADRSEARSCPPWLSLQSPVPQVGESEGGGAWAAGVGEDQLDQHGQVAESFGDHCEPARGLMSPTIRINYYDGPAAEETVSTHQGSPSSVCTTDAEDEGVFLTVPSGGGGLRGNGQESTDGRARSLNDLDRLPIHKSLVDGWLLQDEEGQEETREGTYRGFYGFHQMTTLRPVSPTAGGSMWKSRSTCALPSVKDGPLVSPTSLSPPSYSLSSSMSALQLSPRIERRPLSSRVVRSRSMEAMSEGQDGTGPTLGRAVSPASSGYLGSQQGGRGLPTPATHLSRPGSRAAAPSLPARRRDSLGGGPAGGSSESATEQSTALQGVTTKVRTGASQAIAPASPSPHRRSPVGSVPTSNSQGYPADSSLSADVLSSSPTSTVERRMSMAMAKALGTDNRAGITSRRSPQDLDFIRRALSGNRAPVSPTDILLRRSSSCSGEDSTMALRRKARAASARAKFRRKEKDASTKPPSEETANSEVPGAAVATEPEDLGSCAIVGEPPSKVEAQTEGDSSKADLPPVPNSDSGVSKREAEDAEFFELDDDWQLQAIPFRKRSVTFSGICSKPICRLPGIVERSPTPDSAPLHV